MLVVAHPPTRGLLHRLDRQAGRSGQAERACYCGSNNASFSEARAISVQVSSIKAWQ
jgi:hypothetical protein